MRQIAGIQDGRRRRRLAGRARRGGGRSALHPSAQALAEIIHGRWAVWALSGRSAAVVMLVVWDTHTFT